MSQRPNRYGKVKRLPASVLVTEGGRVAVVAGLGVSGSGPIQHERCHAVWNRFLSGGG